MTQDPLVRRPRDTGSFLAWVLFGIVGGIGIVPLGGRQSSRPAGSRSEYALRIVLVTDLRQSQLIRTLYRAP